jgi:hypothetical protein
VIVCKGEMHDSAVLMRLIGSSSEMERRLLQLCQDLVA